MMHLTKKTMIGRLDSEVTVNDEGKVAINTMCAEPNARINSTITLEELEGIVKTARDLHRRVAPVSETPAPAKKRSRRK